MNPRIVLLCLASGSVALANAMSGWGDAADENVALLWQTASTELVWLAAAFALAGLRRKPGAIAALGLGPSRLGPAGWLVALLGLVALSRAEHVLLDVFELREVGSLGLIDVVVGSSWPQHPALVLVALALAPGVAEELLFRGALLRPAMQRLGAVGGIVAAAALFSAAHLDPLHAAAVFLPGCYLGALTRLSGNVRPAIFCHVANNALAILSSASGLALLPLPDALVVVAGFALSGGCLAVLLARGRPAPEPSESA